MAGKWKGWLAGWALALGLVASGALLGWTTGVGMALTSVEALEEAFGTGRALESAFTGVFTIFAACFGAVAGLVLCPLVLLDREQNKLARACVGVLFSLPVALLAGSTVAEFGPLFAAPAVAFAVVGSYRLTARAQTFPHAKALGRAALVPTLVLGMLAVFLFMHRLPRDPDALLELVAHDSSVRSEESAQRLLEIAGAEGLARALAHPSARVRERVARAAQHFDGADVQAQLLGALDDSESRVRETAYHALLHTSPAGEVEAPRFAWAVAAERAGTRQRFGFQCRALEEDTARVKAAAGE